jgi:nucleoside-diphosphate-sugar epimerase
MLNAIIGHTGFVGSNLIHQMRFHDFYNSKNIETITGKTYDLLVCSGAPAEKWKANKEPLKDLENLNRLTGYLSRVTARKAILISTIDVYPSPVKVDEDTVFDPNSATPYGKHRLNLEKFIESHFDSFIVRLPGLFGNGLKKNIVYDFIQKNNVDQIHADSVFQFYHVDNLWRDIQIALKHRVNLINFATEPVSVHEVAHEGFGFEFANRPKTGPAYYDFRTKHDHLYGGSNGYIYNKQQILTSLKSFVSNQGAQKS